MVLGLACAATLSACGTSQHVDVTDEDPTTTPDAAVVVVEDPLAAFSDATKAFYHLVADGQVSDGRARIYFWPKTMWLDRFGDSPDLAISKLANGAYILGGTFAILDGDDRGRIIAEADAANLALIRADEGLPHTTCGSSTVLDNVTLSSGCNTPPSVVSFGQIGFQASTSAAQGAELEAKIATHITDGGAWDDILTGEVTWTTPAGVLHTKLEIGCIGGVDIPSVELFDSDACHARYPAR